MSSPIMWVTSSPTLVANWESVEQGCDVEPRVATDHLAGSMTYFFYSMRSHELFAHIIWSSSRRGSGIWWRILSYVQNI